MQPFNLYKNKGVVYNVIIESEVGCDEINIEIINKINELITNDDLLHIYFPKIGLGRIYPKYEIIKNIITFTFGISFKDINRNPGIDELSSGSSQNACQFCVYAPICHPDTVEGRRDYKAVSAQEFWEQIQKEVKENG